MSFMIILREAINKMIGGAMRFKYLVDLDASKLNLAGQELREKKEDLYQKICSDLDSQRISILKGKNRESPLTNAVLNFYDLSARRKNSQVEISDSGGDNGTPSKLVEAIDNLWEGISQPTLAFLMNDYNQVNPESLEYGDVRGELENPTVNRAQEDSRSFMLKWTASLLGLVGGGAIAAMYNPLIGIPIVIGSGIQAQDSIKTMIASHNYEKQDNFIHAKEFRNLLHCARNTDKYMNEEIDLTPPGRPIALGSSGEMEEEAIEIAKKLKIE